MISQRFGSVDNMMNDMSKFAGNNPTLKMLWIYTNMVIQNNYTKFSKIYLKKRIFLPKEFWKNF